jgi:protease YdgD
LSDKARRPQSEGVNIFEPQPPRGGGRQGRLAGSLSLRALLILAIGTLAIVAIVPPTAVADVRPEPIPGIIGNDDRKLLDSSIWPWHAIGRLNRTSGGFCTGTLVAPDRVLTARHCLENPRTGRQVQPDTIHFLAGYQRDRWLRHAVGRAFVLPELQAGEDGPEALATDWVLVVLENPLDVKPVPVLALPQGQTVGTRLSRAGYARDRPHLLSRHDGCAVLGHEGNVLVHDCDATFGDSGSPLLVNRNDTTFLVGITTGAGRLNGNDVGFAVDAHAFVDRLR